MRKLKKKIEISFPIAFGTEFEMVVLVTPSISLSIRSVFFLIFNLPLLKQETLFGDLPNIEKICCIAAFYYVQGAAWVIKMANGEKVSSSFQNNLYNSCSVYVKFVSINLGAKHPRLPRRIVGSRSVSASLASIN